LGTCTLRHAAAALALLCAVLIFTACGSSSETNITRPSQSKCQVQAVAEHVSFTPDGGSGTIRVDTTRECTWSAKTDAAWVSLASPVSGQGEGSVQFTVAPNADPVPRASAVIVEDQRLQLSQEGRKCEFRLSSTSESVEATGGERTIQVTTGSAQCRWTSSTDAAWISIAPAGEHSGNGAITFKVDPLAGPERTAMIVVAGETVRVDQGVGCSVTVASGALSVGSAGGPIDVPVSAAPGCPWTVASNTPWISVASGSTGTGSGVASFRVAATDATARTGTVTVAGTVVTITQSPGCAYRLDPVSYAAPQAGGATSVAVATAAGCTWSASSTADWISVTAGQTGSGSGEVRLLVTANSGQPRTASVRVADQALTVTQSPGCTFGVSAASVSVAAAAGSGTVQVTSADGCAWSATSGAPWVTIASGATGAGNGQVQFSVSANPGPARDASLTIAGHTVTVRQATGCTFGVSAASVNVGAPAGNGAVQVTSAEGCSWTAKSGAPWVTIASGATGSGNGQVQYSVAANSGPARDTTLTIAGHTVAVLQANGCTYTVTPGTQDVAASGGGGAATVTTGDACPWTATSAADWISLSTASGTGPGQVPFTAAINLSPARAGRLTIAGQPVTINQPSTCTWVLAPPSTVLAASGGNGNVLVIVTGACTWTATSDVDWITITGGASGTGNGLLQFVAAPSSGAARTGSVTIAGQRYEVSELAR
jgi:hypothetical protein